MVDYRELKKLLDRGGLPAVRLHDLGHTAASLLLAQNVPGRVVMEILGHSQIALTMNTYSHVAPEARARPPTAWLACSGKRTRTRSMTALAARPDCGRTGKPAG